MGSKRNGGRNFGSGTVSRAQRVRRALTLRQAGFTNSEILERIPAYDEFENPVKALEKDLAEELATLTRTPAKQYLALQLARYERLLRAVYREALRGDIPAHKQALATLEAQSKLLGIGNRAPDDGGSDVDVWLDAMLGGIQEAESDEIFDEPPDSLTPKEEILDDLP